MSDGPARAPGLTDRHTERRVLDRFMAGVRDGQGSALVVRGDPGVGKTVLLEYLAARAEGCRVARATGVQSEMELAFAGLHQLCAPLLDRAGHLPEPQHEALRTALGLAAGPPPDRFLVGLAVLGLLSEAASDRPLVCVVDDQQWLDQASAQALGFAARRLAADPVGLVFAARVPGQDVAGLPELAVGGLADGDARILLDSVLTGPLDARVRDQISADTHGNPLALLELPRGLTAAELAGGFGWVTCSGPRPAGCEPRSPTPAGLTRPPGCCCAPLSGSSRWICAWPAIPTWTRCGPRTSPAAWPAGPAAPAARWSARRRRPRCARPGPPTPPPSPTCYSTGWPPRWPRATPRACRT
ncbi:MAG: AAA family ATPase [Streptosporangiaceae bacterium]